MAVTIPKFGWDRHGEVKALWQVRRGYCWCESFRHHEVGTADHHPFELAYDVARSDFTLKHSSAFSMSRAVDPVIIVPALELDPNLKWTTYNPLDEPWLFRKFSRLKEPRECMAFAETYGSLGIGVAGFDEKNRECYAEPLNLWISQASAFRFCLGVARLFHRPEVRNDYDLFMKSFEEICEAESRFQEMTMNISGISDVIIALRSGIDIASYFRPSGYEEDLKKLVMKTVVLFLNQRLSAFVDVQIWPSDLRHVLVIRQLFGALTFSLANAVCGNFEDERFCLGCAEPLDMACRSDRMYCSRACQQKHYRKMKKLKPILGEEHLSR